MLSVMHTTARADLKELQRTRWVSLRLVPIIHNFIYFYHRFFLQCTYRRNDANHKYIHILFIYIYGGQVEHIKHAIRRSDSYIGDGDVMLWQPYPPQQKEALEKETS